NKMSSRPVVWKRINNSKGMSENELKELFIKHDADGDKCLSKKELKKAFKELGILLPEFKANKALSFADTNGDGVITDDEINLLVRYVRQLL
uniref:EF-hand domain-containing protein n=1 Tax=Salmonella sp. s58078 TaxID=3159699 RepID=UPI00397ECF5D